MIYYKIILRKFANVKINFYVLLYLMILLILGTVAEKYIGLYQAQEMFFSTFFIGNLPIPAGYFVISILFINLLAKLLFEEWNISRIGTLTAHIGVLLLIFGGFVTAFFSYEANMIISEGGKSDYISDYYEREIALIEVNEKTKKAYEIAVFKQSDLRSGNTLSVKNMTDFKLKISDYLPNSSLKKRDKISVADNISGVLKVFYIENAPILKEEEQNIAAVKFTFAGKKYAIFEFMPIPQIIKFKGKKYFLEIRKKRTYLPFSIELVDFEKQVYPATNMAKLYKSEVILRDGDTDWRSIISMNKPLRYKGYTLYQSSFIASNNGQATVLSVVENKGRLFPYIASIIICIGLFLHLLKKIPNMLSKTIKSSLFLIFLFPNFAYAKDFNYTEFAKIPILHDGRIKPLDSFARINLLNFSGKESIKYKNMQAIEWLAESLFNPNKAKTLRIFNVPNIEVINSLGLDWRNEHFYSFEELSKAMAKNAKNISKLTKKPTNELSLAQGQLIDLYRKTFIYFNISNSLLFQQNNFIINDASLADAISLPSNKPFSYARLIEKKSQFITLATKSLHKKITEMNKFDRDIINIAKKMREISKYQDNKILRIIPPIWGGDEYISPSIMFSNNGGKINAKYISKYLNFLNNLGNAYLKKDADLWNQIFVKNVKLFQINEKIKNKINMEILYNKINLLQISSFIYLTSFLLFISRKLFSHKTHNYLKNIAFFGIIMGFLIHLSGIILRMQIMSRPPVTTLYESIIFASLISVFFAIIIEFRKRDGLGILVASIIGSILGFIGTKYAVEGDNMGMLSAVLDTNFWLATHVVSITIGYGCCFVASIIAHIYLIKYANNSTILDLQNYYKNIQGTALIALFFVILGTILGGIWADQSWGRFWGWDPKENGAMLIALWLLWLLHGKIAGQIKPLFFAILMVWTNIIVAMAWFGVNLLNVGLHSYGFTKNIAINLGLFIGVEILFVLIILFWKRFNRSMN